MAETKLLSSPLTTWVLLSSECMLSTPELESPIAFLVDLDSPLTQELTLDSVVFITE